MSALISTGEITKLYGINRRKACRWVNDSTFPAPEIDKPKGRKWDGDVVANWVTTNCTPIPEGGFRLRRKERRVTESAPFVVVSEAAEQAA